MGPRTVCFCALVLVGESAPRAEQFDFARVEQLARAVAQQPFQAPTNQVPSQLLQLTYDQYQAIRFRPGKALWANADSPFRVEFFLPGSVHKDTVVIHEVMDGEVKTVPFSPAAFDFGTNQLDLPSTLGYAGFRLIETRDGTNEFASFLGASYFRMIGRSEQFGASARGLALKTTQFGHEEFPVYRQYWLQRPSRDATEVRLWALLDSPSAAGAFEFQIKPGGATVAAVKATFYPRAAVPEFGIAPLTSMFDYDQNSHPPNGDFRPEVHDSDGLLLHTGAGQFLWRPLESGKVIRVNSYLDDNPQGFGLMQRTRGFALYQDIGARYDLRPSVWVNPTGHWGRGRVQLVQLPSHNEYMDNIVAFWIPDHPPQAGQAVNLGYELRWLTNEISSPQLGHVRATRIGQIPAAGPGATNQLRIVVDFGGETLESLAATAKVEAEVTCGPEAHLLQHQLIKNEVNGTWRLVMELTRPSKPLDFQAVLTHRGRAVSETWIWTCQP